MIDRTRKVVMADKPLKGTPSKNFIELLTETYPEVMSGYRSMNIIAEESYTKAPKFKVMVTSTNENIKPSLFTFRPLGYIIEREDNK